MAAIARYIRGEFTPANTAKYIGKYPVIYRSSWEFSMMRLLDAHPGVMQWCSESISIPYRNPLTSRWSLYVPDFLVVFVDRRHQQQCQLIEIKPKREMPLFEGRVSPRTKLTQVINAAKWQAAAAYCAKRRWRFRVATEDDLFYRPGAARPGRGRPA